jgi:hypothetical protein
LWQRMNMRPSIVAAAKATGRSEVACQMLLHGLFRRHFGGHQERLDAVLLKLLGRTPAHAVAEHSLAIREGLDNGPVAVMVIVLHALLAFAPGMGGKSVVPHRLAEDLLPLDLKNQERPAAAKMMGNGNAVLGSDCDVDVRPRQIESSTY